MTMNNILSSNNAVDTTNNITCFCLKTVYPRDYPRLSQEFLYLELDSPLVSGSSRLQFRQGPTDEPIAVAWH